MKVFILPLMEEISIPTQTFRLYMLQPKQ